MKAEMFNYKYKKKIYISNRLFQNFKYVALISDYLFQYKNIEDIQKNCVGNIVIDIGPGR